MSDGDPRIGRALSGDVSAFNELIEEHERLLFNVCLRMLGSRPAAEDAAQEAFLAAWRNLQSLRGPFRPWLLRIASNACTDVLRRGQRRPASSLETALEAGVPEPPDEGVTPEGSLLDGELRGRIEAALLELPEDQRLAVVLRDVQDLDYTEIAVVMKTSLGTVKSRISRGRSRLRELLLQEPELLPARLRPE